MRTHVVEPGESPGSIAIRYVSCPKCSKDLVLHPGNSHKRRVSYPNGYVTFDSLQPGEVLALPDKWFDPRYGFDELPPAYFASLPYADGVSLSPFGVAAAGVLGDYAALEAATRQIIDLASVDDKSFSANVEAAVNALAASVQEVVDGTNARAALRALSVQNAAKWVARRNQELAAAVAIEDERASARTRGDIQIVLTMALADARMALNSYYGSMQPPAAK